MRIYIYLIVSTLFLGYGCTEPSQHEEFDSGKDGWLKGSTADKMNTVANQLRGFDMAMVETGYRYQEVYWAGKDQNWEYALYQIQKIKKTIENGLVRRPKRSESAQSFLEVALPDMEKAINKKDSVNFIESFDLFTNACNTCHAKEEVSFFTVKKPGNRQSPIRR